MIRRIAVTVTASALTLAGLLAAPGATAAEPAQVAARQAAAVRPAYCYSRTNRVTVTTRWEVADDTYGVAYESDAVWVPNSPCRDVNARSVRNAAGPAAGQTVCVPLQVRFVDAGGWVDVCQGWRVLAWGAVEGRPFVVRSALRPVTVVIAS